MKHKSSKIKKLLGLECKNKIELCTPNFCALGCLDETNELEDVVVLKNADVYYKDLKGTHKHKKKLCVCEEYIISFQTVDDE